MIEIMGRLPVIKDFVAILDRREDCRKETGGEENIEGDYGLQAVWGFGLLVPASVG
jgi:hypothetical protein